MEQNNKWSLAALNGLLLSLITIISSLISTVLEPKGVVAILLWIVKFGGSIYLLYYFMKQYSGQFETISYGESFNYGFLLCTFSSIICACFTFVSMTYLFPGQVEKAVEAVQQSMSFNSDQEAALEKWMDRLPQLMLFSTLIYYIVFGAVASSIIANFTKKTDIFVSEN